MASGVQATLPGATTARAPISISPRLYAFARSPRQERSCNVRFQGTAMRARWWTKGVPSILASNTPSQKKAPWIRRFRSPAAKDEPAEFPKHASQAFAHRPGGDELRALCVIDTL